MRLLTVTVLLGVVACTDDSAGELGNGRFEYHCLSEADDLWCTDTDLPGALAVGARFGVTFDPGPRAPVSAIGSTVRSPTGALEESAPGEFLAVTPGWAVLHARSEDDTLVDLIHLHVRAVNGLHVVGECRGSACSTAASRTSLTLAVGEAVQLRALPLDADQDLLAGALAPSWAFAAAGVASVSPVDAGTVTVAGVAPGSAELEVRSGEAVTTVSVEVTP